MHPTVENGKPKSPSALQPLLVVPDDIPVELKPAPIRKLQAGDKLALSPLTTIMTPSSHDFIFLFNSRILDPSDFTQI